MEQVGDFHGVAMTVMPLTRLALRLALVATCCCGTTSQVQGVTIREPSLPSPLAPSRRLILESMESDAPPTYITTNPLRDLPPLSKRHHIYQGIDGSYMDGHPNGVNASADVALQMMVDFARITGSFPAFHGADGTLDTAVEICVNASRLHPTGRMPVLEAGSSPLAFCQGASPVSS